MTAALAATSALAGGEFRHVVFFFFLPSATPEQVKEIEKAFAELPKKIPTITGYEWGTSESVEKLNDGFTHCYMFTFDDVKGLKDYASSDEHRAAVGKIMAAAEKGRVFDFWTKDEPKNASK